MPENNYDIIVIGAASAGLTAALYLARQSLNVLVISKDIGGQALLTDDIQNYPGFMKIGGFDLMNKFQEQAASYGARFEYDEVREAVKLPDGNFKVSTTLGSFTATSLILAFGKTPRNLDVPGEEEFRGRGVSYCAVCDGPLFRNSEIGVVGSGDHVLQAASYLSSLASRLHVVYRGSRVPQDDELYIQLKEMPNVEFHMNSTVSRIKGDIAVDSIEVTPINGGTSRDIKVRGIFVEMGYVARTDFIKDLVKLNSNKEVVTDKLGKTSTEGVFAAGDVTDVPYKQAVISAGQGATAALSAFNYIQSKRGKMAVANDWKNVKPRVPESKVP
ncbi:MAG: glucose-inhibited division protein A [Thermoplasmatales archaeon A-plasma]|jgi:thioredoxin reductase (NADPH)|nr:MAG: glucose-inhibited division protein A [Thermoplasmatales archaeon A-plasma]